jgi:hypothetical protein
MRDKGILRVSGFQTSALLGRLRPPTPGYHICQVGRRAEQLTYGTKFYRQGEEALDYILQRPVGPEVVNAGDLNVIYQARRATRTKGRGAEIYQWAKDYPLSFLDTPDIPMKSLWEGHRLRVFQHPKRGSCSRGAPHH